MWEFKNESVQVHDNESIQAYEHLNNQVHIPLTAH